MLIHGCHIALLPIGSSTVLQAVPIGLVKVSCRREAKHQVEIMQAAVAAIAAQNDVFCHVVSVTFACA